MGKSEINPVLVSDSESDSESLGDGAEEFSDGDEQEELDNEIVTDDDGEGETSRGRPRCRSGPPMVMMVAPWAPMPYLRRAWTPEPEKKSLNQYKSSQSVPEPSCPSGIPAEPAKLKDDHKKIAAEKAVKRWTRWQMFMKYLTDEMCEDSGVKSSAENCVACDVKTDCRERKVHFTGKSTFNFLFGKMSQNETLAHLPNLANRKLTSL